MSKQIISNDQFPLKPHNSEWHFLSNAASLISSGPAVVVPGLVFCSGQVGMGEIKAATVSGMHPRKTDLDFPGRVARKLEKGVGAVGLIPGQSRQVQQ